MASDTAAATMNEGHLLAAILDICKYRRCLVHHCRPARMASGNWVTPIQGDAGFADLVIAGEHGVLFRELKSEKGQLAPGQRSWLALLTGAGADAALWRPSDLTSGRVLAEIEAISR